MRATHLLSLCTAWLVFTPFVVSQISSPSLTPRHLVKPVPQPPALLLNEVCFDPLGVDAQAALGSEYVELYARSQVQLGSFALTDNMGTALAPLPSVTVPAGSHVLIILGGGQNAYDPDSDLSDGLGAFMLGLPPADHLGNGEGGVRLVNGAGKIVDAVYWGTGSAPQGATGPAWASGSYLDLSMAGRPMNEGDSIGRSLDPLGDYTGQLANWDRHGGVNGAGPTPKHRNGVNRADQGSLLKWAQAGVNQIVTGFGSATQSGWFSFKGSSVSNVVVTEQEHSLTVVADHSFSVDEFGSPTTLAGQITAICTWSEAPGAVGYTLSAVGSLSFPSGAGFSIDHAEVMSGFHTNAVGGTFSTDTVYTELGVAYPFSVDAVMTLARTGQDTWARTDSRVCNDYGGAGPKSSETVTALTRLSDGSYSSACLMKRDFPIAPPIPGDSDSILFQETKIVETVSTTLNDLGEFDTQITRYDVFMGGTLSSTLPSGQVGMASLRYQPASVSEPLGGSLYQLSLPREQGSLGFTVDARLQGSTALIDGNIVYSSLQQISIDGVFVEGFAFSIDPPLPCGSYSTDSGSGSGGGAGFGAAAATCAGVGAGIGAAAGTLVGGVAGAIGGAAVGSAALALGGPVGIVAGATAGGAQGAAAGVYVGAGAGGVVGAGIGALACSVGWLWDRFF